MDLSVTQGQTKSIAISGWPGVFGAMILCANRDNRTRLKGAVCMAQSDASMALKHRLAGGSSSYAQHPRRRQFSVGSRSEEDRDQRGAAARAAQEHLQRLRPVRQTEASHQKSVD